MCCRYYIEPDNTELQSISEAARSSVVLDRFHRAVQKALITGGEIAPSMIVPVIARNRSGIRSYFPMQWGYNLERKNLLVNARIETAAQKPMFQESWYTHRCIIPASYYFEWQHYLLPNGRKDTGDRYLLQPRGAAVTWLCGLYRLESGLPHFVILTRPPSEPIGFIHDRMPLIIAEKDIDDWINPTMKAEEIAYRALTDIYFQRAG